MINDKINSQRNEWNQNTSTLSPKQENVSNIDTNDIFKKSDTEDSGNLSSKFIKDAIAGAGAGVNLANRSEIRELKKKIEALESQQPAKSEAAEKSMYPKYPDPDSSAATVKYAKECLEKYKEYDEGADRASFFRQALNHIAKSGDSTPTEKILAEFALKEDNNYNTSVDSDYPYITHASKHYAGKFSSAIGTETLEFLANPENTKGSFGKVMMNLYTEIGRNIKRESRDFEPFTKKREPEFAFQAVLDGILQSDRSSCYEKNTARFWQKMNPNFVTNNFWQKIKTSFFVPWDRINFVKQGISKASEDSSPIIDMTNWTPEAYILPVSDQIFNNIINSPRSSEIDKNIAQKGLEYGQKFHMATKDQLKAKREILEQIKPDPSIDLTQGLEKFAPWQNPIEAY